MSDYIYCSKCGQKNLARNQICHFCNAPLAVASVPPKARPEKQDTLVLRPVFVGWVNLVSYLPLFVFFTIWGTGFCGGFGSILFKALGLPRGGSFLLAFLFFAFVVPVIVYNVRKRTVQQTVYRFTPTKFEYFEGFWTVEEKEIELKHVMEVTLRRGVLQRNYNLGTLVLATPATGTASGSARSGIEIRDIENPDKVYKQVKDWIAKAKSPPAA